MHKHDHHDHSHHQHGDTTEAPDAMTAKDPVCGMTVQLDQGKPSRKYEGETYHFCSQKCHDKFAADPEAYLGDKPAQVAMPAGTIYTCPMHPEIEQVGPGDCPICGMALEPKGVPTGDEGPNPELVDFTRRFWVGVVLTVPLLILTMPPYIGYPQMREYLGEQTSLWIEVIIGSPVILWSGWPFFVRGYKSFRTMNLNMFSLIGMGVGAAYLFSIVAVLAPGIFPDGFRDPETGAVGVYFDGRQDRAGDPLRRHGRGDSARGCAGRRPAAGAPRRQGAGGW